MHHIVLGTGLLGSALVAELAHRARPHLALDHAAIDAAGRISRAAAAAVSRGDVVVNATAMTNVDGCESRAEEALEVNGEEPGRLARLCAERGATLVHVSTDTVLDVTNVYAQSKALGEQRVREAVGEEALIVRVSTVFGPHAKKVDFPRFVVSTLRKGEEVRAVTDMICSPTYTLDAAPAILAAVAGGARGTHAFVNEPAISRHEFALAIQRAWDVEGTVRGVPMSEFPFKARRPKDTRMSSTLDAWHKPLSLDACLADYRARWR